MPDLILYDGVCGLCNRAVRFFLKRDRKHVFRFASLQSGLAGDVLKTHGRTPDALQTFYVVRGFGVEGERVLSRSEAALYAIGQLGGVWKAIARALGILPRGILDWFYDLIARHRYRVFGKYDVCPLPDPADRGRFME